MTVVALISNRFWYSFLSFL